MSLNIFITNETSFKLKNIEEFLMEISQEFIAPSDILTEISLLFCDNSTIQKLNSEFRNINKPTDVLSFPAEMDFYLGDIAISLEKAQEQAQTTFAEEIAMLLCHGFLHLLGYDHEKSDKDYDIMMNLQASLLKKTTTEITVL